jgi:hypothetical protein
LRSSRAAKIDHSTGSNFTTLADRGLNETDLRGLDLYTHARITPAGRKLVRSRTGAKMYKAPTGGTLRERQKRALAAAAAARVPVEAPPGAEYTETLLKVGQHST